MNTPIEHLTRDDMPSSHLPFSPAVAVGDLIFVSGQASVDATGKIINDTFEGEMRRSMENMRAILEASGSSLEKVVQVRAYVDNPDDLKQFNEIYAAYFKEPRPARTTLLNCFRGLLKFEVDCIATR